ncbi:hypothetical protein ACFUJY_22760 [Streptomyces sp. NPDC057249]|uniref:hypothetical protein n=1 Tax=Streptomyces sp. NPDC057249 TaxID=3346067 RepID=UPI003642D8FE
MDVVEFIKVAAQKRRKKGWRVFSASMPLSGARWAGSSNHGPGYIEDDLSSVIQVLEDEGWTLEQVTPFAVEDGSSGPRFRALVVFRYAD